MVRWAYWDYRHLAHLLPPHLLATFPWASLGLQGRDGGESTLWVGTRGAHTPCHQVHTRILSDPCHLLVLES